MIVCDMTELCNNFKKKHSNDKYKNVRNNSLSITNHYFR